MAAARRVAIEQGWAETLIHSEAFQPVAMPAGAEEGETFSVTLASSGERWPVPPHKTIAQVLAGKRRRRPPLLRDGDLRRLPDAGYRRGCRPSRHRTVGGGEIRQRAADSPVLLAQPVGESVH